MPIVDLSHPIKADAEQVPEFLRTDIAYGNHAAGASEIEAMFGVAPRLLRDGEGWATERLSLGTHSATHVDAPYHYNSRIGGQPAATIDELPLERFFGPGVVVDVTDHEDGDAVTSEQMRAGIADAGHELRAGDIVLVRTGRDAFYGRPDYMFRGCGVSAEATRWLWEQGVEVMGIDAWGWDSPLDGQARAAIERDEPGVFWAAHQVDLPYSQIERLANLGALPPTGFTVACFPLKIAGASAAPARVVAFVD